MINEVTLTEQAARRIEELRTRAQNPALNLRLSVHGGGCSGFKYEFSTDTAPQVDDHIFARDNAKLFVDEVSLPFLEGAQIHFVEDLMGSYFEVQNPNAASGCGCGTSFSVKES